MPARHGYETIWSEIHAAISARGATSPPGNSNAIRFRWRPACRVCSRLVTCATTPSNEYRVAWARAACLSRLSTNTWRHSRLEWMVMLGEKIPLQQWSSFFSITSAASATLLGLLFVVITIALGIGQLGQPGGDHCEASLRLDERRRITSSKKRSEGGVMCASNRRNARTSSCMPFRSPHRAFPLSNAFMGRSTSYATACSIKTPSIHRAKARTHFATPVPCVY
jgi:hypothetical protein